MDEKRKLLIFYYNVFGFYSYLVFIYFFYSLNNKGSQDSISELVEDPPTAALKTFHAKTVQSLSDCEIPANSEFRPIQSISEHEGYQSSSEIEKLLAKLNSSDNNLNLNIKTNGKKKRRRKKKTPSIEVKTEGREEIKEQETSKFFEEINANNDDVYENYKLQVSIILYGVYFDFSNVLSDHFLIICYRKVTL